jgi:predicted TIM-barrel fold metal-dependent hydrolase
MKPPYPVISADSHITEPHDAYKTIVPKYRDRAPRIETIPGKGDCYIVDGLERPLQAYMHSAAGRKPEEMSASLDVRWEAMHKGGWDPRFRLADQARDGVSAEVIYPTVGMVMCGHADFDLKKAVFDAYNDWIAEYCSYSPMRLLGAGQTAVRSPDEAIKDLERIKRLGLRTVMMPAFPAQADYDSKIYDEFWSAAISLDLPISFHVLTGGKTLFQADRGPRINSFLGIIRSNQDLIGTFVFGGVFERHPKLKMVCVESDAGWVPHYMYRMDHAFSRHRNWIAPDVRLSKEPSEYVRENIYFTFQDDWIAIKVAHLMNSSRLMWANDFPHSDSTWPWSQELLKTHTKELTEEQTYDILCGNVAELYRIDPKDLQAESLRQAS